MIFYCYDFLLLWFFIVLIFSPKPLAVASSRWDVTSISFADCTYHFFIFIFIFYFYRFILISPETSLRSHPLTAHIIFLFFIFMFWFLIFIVLFLIFPGVSQPLRSQRWLRSVRTNSRCVGWRAEFLLYHRLESRIIMIS